MRHSFFFVATFASYAVNAQQVLADGPLGVTIGDKLDNYPSCKQEAPFYALCSRLPKEHPALATFGVQLTPETGICSVTALSKDIDTGADGSQLRQKLEDIVGQISINYGSSKHFDLLTEGSIWKENKYWTMSIMKDDRAYSYFWSKEVGSSMKLGVNSISVIPKMYDQYKGYYLLKYEFDNFLKCISIIKRANAGAL